MGRARGVPRPDHAAAASELARVSRAGGRIGLVAWRADPEAERMHAYDGVAGARVDSLHRPLALEYRRAFIAYHERHRMNGRISLPRRCLLTLGRRRGGTAA